MIVDMNNASEIDLSKTVATAPVPTKVAMKYEEKLAVTGYFPNKPFNFSISHLVKLFSIVVLQMIRFGFLVYHYINLL